MALSQRVWSVSNTRRFMACVPSLAVKLVGGHASCSASASHLPNLSASVGVVIAAIVGGGDKRLVGEVHPPGIGGNPSQAGFVLLIHARSRDLHLWHGTTPRWITASLSSGLLGDEGLALRARGEFPGRQRLGVVVFPVVDNLGYLPFQRSLHFLLHRARRVRAFVVTSRGFASFYLLLPVLSPIVSIVRRSISAARWLLLIFQIRPWTTLSTAGDVIWFCLLHNYSWLLIVSCWLLTNGIGIFLIQISEAPFTSIHFN